MNGPFDRPWQRRWLAPAAGVALAVFAICVLMTEHLSHVPRALTYLLILACPLVHLFGGHRHGARHRHRHDEAR
jgi:peptidoglycan/LPS O-acetylase OafA/YrhL